MHCKLASLLIIIGVPLGLGAQNRYIGRQETPEARAARVARTEPVCRQKASQLRPAVSPRVYVDASRAMSDCPEAGAVLLAQAWQTPPNDSVRLSALVDNSILLRDRRLLDGVVTAASNSKLPPRTRLSAFQVLVSFVNPHFVLIEVDQMLRLRTYSIGYGSHHRADSGARPLTPADAERIYAAFSAMGAMHPYDIVKDAAFWIAKGLEDRRKQWPE